MTVRDIHLEIEQRLYNGVFANKDFDHDEIDLHFNEKVSKLVDSFLDDTMKQTDGVHVEVNQYATDVLRVLKRTVDISRTLKTDNVCYFPLPQDYQFLLNDKSHAVSYKGCKLTNAIENNQWYKVESKNVKYVDKWYKKDDVFQSIGNGSSLYPKESKVYKLISSLVANRLTKSEDLSWVLDDTLHNTKFKSPISELVNNDLLVYIDDSFDVFKVRLTYYKKIRKINYQAGVTSEFSDNFIYHVIDNVVKSLKS